MSEVLPNQSPQITCCVLCDKQCQNNRNQLSEDVQVIIQGTFYVMVC